MVYNDSNSTNLAPSGQNNIQYYTNCFVVNIDGPINFNATHSLLDDGSDLPISDVNTIRFFYNLGIEVNTKYIWNFLSVRQKFISRKFVKGFFQILPKRVRK